MFWIQIKKGIDYQYDYFQVILLQSYENNSIFCHKLKIDFVIEN